MGGRIFRSGFPLPPFLSLSASTEDGEAFESVEGVGDGSEEEEDGDVVEEGRLTDNNSPPYRLLRFCIGTGRDFLEEGGREGEGGFTTSGYRLLCFCMGGGTVFPAPDVGETEAIAAKEYKLLRLCVALGEAFLALGEAFVGLGEDFRR